MICPRCAKEKNGIHTCNPSEFVRELEARVAALTKERDEAISAVQRLREGQSFDVVVAADITRRGMEQLAAAQAEIERLKVVCSDYRRIEEEMLGTLLTTQAVNEKLREALMGIRECFFYVMEHPTSPSEYHHTLKNIGAVCERALVLPSDTTALQARLAKERERCAKVCEQMTIETVGASNLTADQCAREIRSMT